MWLSNIPNWSQSWTNQFTYFLVGGLVLSFWTTNSPLSSRFHLSPCGSLNIDIMILSLLTSPSLSSFSHSRLLLMSWANSPKCLLHFPRVFQLTFKWSVMFCVLASCTAVSCCSLFLSYCKVLFHSSSLPLAIRTGCLGKGLYHSPWQILFSVSFHLTAFLEVTKRDTTIWLPLCKSKTKS